MFKFGTMKTAIAGAAAAVALVGFASPASAAQIYLKSASMNTGFQASLGSLGYNAYSNGITFQVADSPTDVTLREIYAFCIDVYHHISLGGLNLEYTSTYGNPANPITTNYAPGNPSLSTQQIEDLTNLIETGHQLHRDDPTGTAMQTAAIQAAIWRVANPTLGVNVSSAGLDGATFTAYETLFNNYVSGNYQSLRGPDDLAYIFYNGSNQTFAAGWPVPEPGTWALMIGGFGLAGVALRRRRAAMAAA